MTLLANSQLGPYEIVDLLGAGGMGEVYRARDPRLGHEVLLTKLKSPTSLRAVRDTEDPTGWTIELGPFPGWKEVPEW